MQTAANDEKNSIANSADAINRWIKGGETQPLWNINCRNEPRRSFHE